MLFNLLCFSEVFSFRDKRQSHCRCGHSLLSHESGLLFEFIVQGPFCLSITLCSNLMLLLSASESCLFLFFVFQIKDYCQHDEKILRDFQTPLKAAKNVFFVLFFLSHDNCFYCRDKMSDSHCPHCSFYMNVSSVYFLKQV